MDSTKPILGVLEVLKALEVQTLYCNGNKRNIITSLSDIPNAIVFTYSTLLNGFVFDLLLVVVSMVIIGVGQGST